MEIRVISPKPIQANIMCPLLPADHQCVAYVRQRIPIDRTEIECGMSRCVSGGRVSSSQAMYPVLVSSLFAELQRILQERRTNGIGHDRIR